MAAMRDVLPRASGLGKLAHGGESEGARRGAVEIDETEAAALGRHLGGKRVVAERAAAEMGGDAADVGDLIGLDAEEDEAAPVGCLCLEGHAGEAEEAGRVARRQEGLDEGGLDQVEVGLAGRIVAMLVRGRGGGSAIGRRACARGRGCGPGPGRAGAPP